MAPETGRALRRAFTAFAVWCAAQAAPPLPASPALVAAYIDHLSAIPGRKASGIRQAAWAIGAMHRLSGDADPTKVEPVRLALKRMARQLGTRQQQAAPIGQYEVRRIIDTAGSRLSDLRNLALVLVMRDLLARRSEVVALDVADIAHDPDGSGTAMIRRSKTDQTGEGLRCPEPVGRARPFSTQRAWQPSLLARTRQSHGFIDIRRAPARGRKGVGSIPTARWVRARGFSAPCGETSGQTGGAARPA